MAVLPNGLPLSKVTPNPNGAAIVQFGRMFQDRYPIEEYLKALTKAFIEHCADFITLDSLTTNQRFRAASVSWAIDMGILYQDVHDTSDEQCEVTSFRLTVEGKQYLIRRLT